MKSTITDKQRLDFLQGLARRTEPGTNFNGQVKQIPVDSELHIRGGGDFYVMRRDIFGHGDDAGFTRKRKSVRAAIDAAMAHQEKT